jgi:hypothetical protein
VDGEVFQRGECSGLFGHRGDCADAEERRSTRYRVLAMNRWGRGHIVGWCDSTSLVERFDAQDLGRYLGRVATPRVATIGDGWCGRLRGRPTGATHLGSVLPPQYVADPAVLAADWDVLVFCPRSMAAADASAIGAAITRFVVEDGRGALIAMDYWVGLSSGSAYLDAVNATTRSAGFAFDAIDLGPTSGTVELDCVADY